jgi:hypothetical protein
LELVGYGPYATLGWERWATVSEGPVDTGTQIISIVTASSFVAADTYSVPTTGVSISQYRPDQNLTLLQEVERLASLGDSSGESLWPQVLDNRTLYLSQWGGGDFPAIDYSMDRRGVHDQNGARIPLWNVRADRVIQTPQYIPGGFGVFTDPLDTPHALYLLETELRIDEKAVTLLGKPAGWKDFVQMLRVG